MHVRKFKEERRSRNVTDHEFNAILSIAKYPINYGMKLMYFMGLRPQEVLYLKIANCLENGFLIELTKTKNTISKKLVQWTPQLKALVEEVLKLNQLKSKQGHLLCNKQGKAYTHNGFTTLWSRTMQKALESQLISQPFQF